MRQRIRYLVPLSVVLLFFLLCSPVIVQAEVEVKVVSLFNLDKKPLDTVFSGDGKWAYVLTSGEVQVYSLGTKSLRGRFPVDKEVLRISVSSKGDQLLLMNEKTKTLSLISVAFFQMFSVDGSPFKGPADAPVVITVFSDYQ